MIVDGPSAAGFYLIEVPIDRSSIRTPEEVLQAIHKHQEVISFAEVTSQ
jgi:hypothetical protein